jgi:hypothetical protein
VLVSVQVIRGILVPQPARQLDHSATGVALIITGAGSGDGPNVQAFDGSNPAIVLDNVFANDAAFLGGIFVG